MAKLFANSGDPDQMPHSAASDLGLHCLPITFYGSPDYNGLKDESNLVGHFVSSPREREKMSNCSDKMTHVNSADPVQTALR